MDIYEKIEKYSDIGFGIDLIHQEKQALIIDGYTLAHPEIAQFRAEGAPSVSVRKA